MLIELSYWDVEAAIIDYLKKEYDWDVKSDQIEGGQTETTVTTYAYKKDKDGNQVLDRAKSTTKKKNLSFDGNSELSLFIDAKETDINA